MTVYRTIERFADPQASKTPVQKNRTRTLGPTSFPKNVTREQPFASSNGISCGRRCGKWAVGKAICVTPAITL